MSTPSQIEHQAADAVGLHHDQPPPPDGPPPSAPPPPAAQLAAVPQLPPVSHLGGLTEAHRLFTAAYETYLARVEHAWHAYLDKVYEAMNQLDGDTTAAVARLSAGDRAEPPPPATIQP